MNRFIPSHDFVTCPRSPEVSSTAFDAQPPDLPPVSLMDMGFAITCPLARHRRPLIRFLFIGSRLCSTLLSGPASPRVLFHPCASLSLHLHQVVKRTCTSKLSNMLGTQSKRRGKPRLPQSRSLQGGLPGLVGFHPRLENQDGGHPVNRLPSLLDRKIGFTQQPVGFGRGPALVPKMDGHVEVSSQIVGKTTHLLRLRSFSAAQA